MFGLVKKTKTPADVCKSLHTALNNTDGIKPPPANGKDAAHYLAQAKAFVVSSEQEEVQPETVLELAAAMAREGLAPLLIRKLPLLSFEGRKDIGVVLGRVLRVEKQAQSFKVTRTLAANGSELIGKLISGYDTDDTSVSLNCGVVLREFATIPMLVPLLVNHEDLFKFFEYVQHEGFETSADAFASFSAALTSDKPIVCKMLLDKYDSFFSSYRQLLESENYVTRRQSLKLLGQILMEKANQDVMMKYIVSPSNLVLIMTLLRDSSKSIQYEAFQVFKIFVANPSKPPQIIDMLIQNKEKLILYLSNFQNDREDPQFKEEKMMLIREISGL
mmetsp:Transcript_1527/g.5260  ORF Transcript_1527/g.5260 Transcript_1527/m.5260 type:complete len:332 (-) Transcript_1527:1046-2041(-)